MLCTPHHYFLLKQSLNMLKVTHHLKLTNRGLFILFNFTLHHCPVGLLVIHQYLVEHLHYFSKIAHVYSSLVEEFLQTLRVCWHSFRLLEIRDKIWNRFFGDILCHVFYERFLFLSLIF